MKKNDSVPHFPLCPCCEDPTPRYIFLRRLNGEILLYIKDDNSLDKRNYRSSKEFYFKCGECGCEWIVPASFIKQYRKFMEGLL